MVTYELNNPVGIYFGAILKKWRNESFEEAREIAEKTQLTNSFYRMIESGLAKLHPKKSILLCQAFPKKNINLYGLSTVMTLTYLTAETKTKEELIQTSLSIIAQEKSLYPIIETITNNYEKVAQVKGARRTRLILKNGLEKPLEDIILNKSK